MKYRVGEYVVIRDDINKYPIIKSEFGRFVGVNAEMCKLAGNTAKITLAFDGLYHIDIDGERWAWVCDMFDELAATDLSESDMSLATLLGECAGATKYKHRR